MAPGDLNLKKSWFPKLMKNQAKVWEMEQEALQEHKKIQERQLEFEKEKQKKELIDLQIKNNPHLKNKLISNKIDWMYDDPTKNHDSSLNDERDKEDYLLGRKKINLNNNVNKAASASRENKNKNDRLSAALATTAPSERDTLAKAKNDPMAKFKQAQARTAAAKQREKQLLKDRQSRDSSRIRPDYNDRPSSYRPSRFDDRDRSAYRADHRDERDERYRAHGKTSYRDERRY